MLQARARQPRRGESGRLLTYVTVLDRALGTIGLMTGFLAVWLLASVLPARAAVIPADPSDYKTRLSQLQPGDTLQLASGTYTRLNLTGISGQPDAWITITGPESGDPAVIAGESCCNTVQLQSNSYLVIKNLTIDSLGLANIDGINAKSGSCHDVVIENNIIVGAGENQGTVGISTKTTTWNWTIRNNTIIEPGTGMYLGNSNGASPFIAGIVEGNLVLNPRGYCIQIKHQVPYDKPDVPAGPHATIIRNNVLIKDDRPSDSGDRPNLLVGPFPEEGQGSTDLYEIYGNFIYNNPRENLIQASGRVAIHDNVLVGLGNETAIYLTDHNGPLKLAYVYNNTIYGGARGIRFISAAREDHWVIGNVVFSGDPIGGNASQIRDNLVDEVANAGTHVVNPATVLGEMDFFPKQGQCQGASLDYPAGFLSHVDHEFDFNGDAKNDFRFRGAYAGEGTNPGWQLAATRKVGGPSGTPDDPPSEPPPPPTILILY